MKKYVVTKNHDSFAQYETVIEAASPQEAHDIATSCRFAGEWHATGEMTQFDDFEINTPEEGGVRELEEGEVIEGVQSVFLSKRDQEMIVIALNGGTPQLTQAERASLLQRFT